MTAGINRTTALLRQGKIRVNKKKCKNFVKEILAYSWEKRKVGDLGNLKERPRKAFDHLMDAFRYVVQSRPEKYDRPERDVFGNVVEPVGTFDFIEEGDKWESII